MRALASFSKVALVTFLIATILPVVFLRWIDPPFSSIMLQSTGQALWRGEEEIRYRFRWTDWDQIPAYAKLAVVTAEDQRFPNHHGFDLKSIRQAWSDRKKRGRLRGASTITQQTAKNLFLWPARSWIRKGLEGYFTVLIELFWPKRRILEIYLNIAQFGARIYGVGAAAETYFGKSGATLERGDAALLAAVLPNPIRYRADNPSPYVYERRNWILKQMDQLGGSTYLRDL